LAAKTYNKKGERVAPPAFPAYPACLAGART
jgi:hypothetical protein